MLLNYCLQALSHSEGTGPVVQKNRLAAGMESGSAAGSRPDLGKEQEKTLP